MKLSSKLNKGMIILLTLLILSSVLTSIFLFNNSLESFANHERNKLFEQISKDIESFAQTDQGLNPIILDNYSKNQNLLIRLYGPDNNLIQEFDGLQSDMRNSQYALQTIRLDLVNYNQEAIGKLDISYVADVFAFDESIQNFRYEIVRNYTILFLAFLLLGSIYVIVFSKKITEPINDLKSKANKLRQRNYKLESKNYNIYEIDQLSSDIDYLATTLHNQDKLRTDYAHDIAHELRTPLTNLLLHLEGIKDEVIEADQHTLDLLLAETQRLNKMIDNLEVSFNNSEKLLEINLEDVEIEDLLENVTSSFLPLMNERNIEVNYIFSKENTIYTDRDKLSQIITNLLSNAIKAVDNGGKIDIIHQAHINRDVIIISDNGVGISQDNIEHIFERFFRVDNVRNTKVSGHGLGLSITKTFADLLGYKISVNSKEGKGSEFIITISK